MTAPLDIRNSACGISPTRHLAILDLAICDIKADIGKEHGDTSRNVQHADRSLRRYSAAGTCAGYVWLLTIYKALAAKRSFCDRRVVEDLLSIDA